MAKKVSFENLHNEDGESDVRAVTEEVRMRQEEPRTHSQMQAHEDLDVVSKFVSSKEDVDLARNYGIHRVNAEVIRELATRRSSGKSLFQFSDGNMELLRLTRKKLGL